MGSKSNGKPAMHSFDLVSEDNQIVAEVKSHQMTKGGNIPSGKISDTYQACFMLEKVDARKKLLILTDLAFCEIFKRYSEGKISKGIEIGLLANGHGGKERPKPETMPLEGKWEMPKKTDFDVFWARLTTWLGSEKRITNWTANRGETGEDFEAVHAGGNYITVYLESAGIQRVPKKDFKPIYENWDGYAKGLIPRYHFVKGPIANSRFTKYTISIIHQYLDDEE